MMAPISSPQVTNPMLAREEYWKHQIKLKQESRLSRAAYCRLHGVNYDQFGYWEQKFIGGFQSSELLPIKLIPSQEEESSNPRPIATLCTLVLKSGNELKVHDKSILADLLSTLG